MAYSRRVDEIGRDIEAKVDEAEQRDVEVHEGAHDAVVDVVREFLERRIEDALCTIRVLRNERRESGVE